MRSPCSPSTRCLERYAWFLTRTADSADFAMATLLDAAGNPTALGTDYINAAAFR